MQQNHPLRRPAATFSLILFLAAIFPGGTIFAQPGFTGIFGGGPLYINATNNITELKNSGFTEVIVWSVEVKTNGDLNLNGEFPLTSNGVYIGDQLHPDFAANMATLKEGTVRRITFSIGSSNFGDWQDIRDLVNSQGTGQDSILYKDFAALKAAIPALDAIDFDDENSFDSATTIQFGAMLGQLGYNVNPDPFDNSSSGKMLWPKSTVSFPALSTGFICRPMPAAAETIRAWDGISEMSRSGPDCGTWMIHLPRCRAL